MATTPTVTALTEASAGLLYPSETDAPWAVFSWPDATGEPTGDGVRRRGRHRASAPLQEQTLDAVFAPLVLDQDWYGGEEKAVVARYAALLAVVRRSLTSPKVVKVGGVRVAVYVLGVGSEGGWAGLKTTAVET